SKEEQFQEGFLRELFVSMFGYTLNPQPNFDLTTELKNIANSKKADGAILKGKDAIAVIELKGTDTTDLDKIETQAFGYKNHHPKCIYVITSNFEKLRFYIQNAVDHIDFDLFNLTKKQFSLMWLCLAKDNLLNGLPQKIKESSLLQEENITKKLYADYSKFREAIYNNLVKNNPETDKLLLFKKTQKLLDRFLFIFFAEDRLLLPPNSISEIVKQWKTLKEDLDEYVPLYDRFKKYFGYMNTGYKGKKYAIYAYNGGLFAPDEILDNILIDDDILHKHTLTLSQYDFETDVDVNILGHIFEHSLGEIENVQAEIKGEKIDSQKTRRKKDGIFYTPKYITKYIVENTVGKLCEEKRRELDIVDEEYAKGRKNRKKDTIKTLDDKLVEYRNWLLTLTILDPACGSGAFLNQALDFLITEHRKIDDLRAQLFGSGLVFSDITTDILEKNIYGVDLNEESVEIAKLSLWLRTAQKGRKLNTLSNNIKCGNSLIDDPEVAGEKAFIWQNEFPEIFANGGFDVVIGNPPYVRQELFKDIKPSLEKEYACYNSIADLYTYFIEQGIKLMSKTGYFSFILPNKFMRANYGKEIREVILREANIDLIFDFDDYPVFDDATTYPIIFVFSKSQSDKFYYSEINKRSNTLDPINVLEQNKIQVLSSSMSSDAWTFNDSRTFSVLEKLKNSSIELKEFVDDKIFRGVSTGCNEVFIADKETIKPFENSPHLKKIFMGKEVKRYKADFQELYLLFLTWDYDLENDDKIKTYLLNNEEKLSARPEVKEGRFNWWCLSRYGSKNSHLLTKPKIIYPRINNECNFFLDVSGEYSLSDNNFFISSGRKDLLALLNSKLIFFYLKNNCSTLQGGYYDFRRPFIEKIPIIKSLLSENKHLILLADKATSAYSAYNNAVNLLVNILKSKFTFDKVSKKLENWHELEFSEFLKELEKARKAIVEVEDTKLTLSEEAEWMEYFKEQKGKVFNAKSEIEKTDKEIDQMVYKLYGLTKEEIKIVDENV
ncbi:MAG: Eco57I restriction-modification methylase domain-containing protein, partial [Bacteroidales bacterium]|nr:Eco57I restriction-modification methylase domain-containing protein [Bacteroidales bacterium]